MTIQAKLVGALQSEGEKVIESRTSKYIVLTRSTNSEELPYFYVGKNGALRTGKTVASSLSIPNKAKRLLDRYFPGANNEA